MSLRRLWFLFTSNLSQTPAMLFCHEALALPGGARGLGGLAAKPPNSNGPPFLISSSPHPRILRKSQVCKSLPLMCIRATRFLNSAYSAVVRQGDAVLNRAGPPRTLGNVPLDDVTRGSRMRRRERVARIRRVSIAVRVGIPPRQSIR